MKSKTSGIAVLIIGLACIGGSLYIQDQVVQGKAQVSSAQGKVNQGNSLFSLVPGGKEVGSQLSHPFQEKIAEGTQEIQKYERIAHFLMIGGIILGIIGIGMLIIRAKK